MIILFIVFKFDYSRSISRTLGSIQLLLKLIELRTTILHETSYNDNNIDISIIKSFIN